MLILRVSELRYAYYYYVGLKQPVAKCFTNHEADVPNIVVIYYKCLSPSYCIPNQFSLS